MTDAPEITYERRGKLTRWLLGDKKITSMIQASEALHRKRTYNSAAGAEAIGLLGHLKNLLNQDQYFEGTGHS